MPAARFPTFYLPELARQSDWSGVFPLSIVTSTIELYHCLNKQSISISMSERANFRGGRGGRGGDRGGRGGADRGGRGGHAGGERKKENILDLTKYMEKDISVKFNGGREGTWISVR